MFFGFCFIFSRQQIRQVGKPIPRQRFPEKYRSQTGLALYGINEDPTDGFGHQCLLARQFAEAGMRFIEPGHGSWDQYSNIQTALANNCAESDKPIAGLFADLKRHDLLKDTLFLWGCEFGRTPYYDSSQSQLESSCGLRAFLSS
ncbi:DUF1501 domain-containing protein [Gimesia algae]|uniref:Uncharacterized protein n=1 Tax=Gimesia algae TaxID=2527971 RepID=A0A517VA41_9PLAN|nr:DUF1501 domain-containing protein [Gimesia algae]QDT89838.1 hypothetical protein Pan161_14710 [Gimesia algae]